MRQLHEKTSWEGQKHLDRCIGGDKWAGGEAPTSVLGLWELLPSLSGSRLPSFAFWVPLLCPLPPPDGLIPVTSTDAPVMYPLSSDAKNATTSATSMGMVGRGQNPTHSQTQSSLLSESPLPQPPILVRPSQIPQTLGSLPSGPLCSQCSPSGSPICPIGIIPVTCKETLMCE